MVLCPAPVPLATFFLIDHDTWPESVCMAMISWLPQNTCPGHDIVPSTPTIFTHNLGPNSRPRDVDGRTTRPHLHPETHARWLSSGASGRASPWSNRGECVPLVRLMVKSRQRSNLTPPTTNQVAPIGCFGTGLPLVGIAANAWLAARIGQVCLSIIPVFLLFLPFYYTCLSIPCLSIIQPSARLSGTGLPLVGIAANAWLAARIGQLHPQLQNHALISIHDRFQTRWYKSRTRRRPHRPCLPEPTPSSRNLNPLIPKPETSDHYFISIWDVLASYMG